ncbi:uncharacterized protein LOC126577972 [Anopheles aquasalis]|uniref:uncharacterized protein LOC126577972 n=1 Tax=Anopheles aquasalis TaxID=42839 RepID=UPI00215B07D8|nr:uncharacterized protein LOC126577972 [Anopheles aquasalis]
MSSLACDTRFDLLPVELLIMIFDHLDLDSLKNATQTCRNWHNVAFRSTYIERFKLEMGLPQLSRYFKKDEHGTPIEKRKIKKLITEAVACVRKSQRYYDSLRLNVLPYMLAEFQPLWSALQRKVTANINSLELDLKQTPDKSIVTLLANTIELMPKLRSLSLWTLCGPPSYIVFRHSSVQHLKLHCTNFIAVDMPQLESFEGPLCALAHPQPLVLTKLKHVTLTFGPDRLYGPSIIQRLAQVETMKLIFRVTESLFLAICETCTVLKELNFWHVTVSDRATTRHLSRLVYLRRLTFHSIGIEGKCSFDLDFDLVELTRLEELNLGYIELGETSLIRLPFSIRALTVSISVANEVNVIQSLVSSARQLQKLRLVYDGSKTTDVVVYTMKCLHLFALLEVLVFVNAKISERVFLDMDGPMYRMHYLRFENCDLDRNNLNGLCEMFPNVPLVEFPTVSSWFWAAKFTDTE